VMVWTVIIVSVKKVVVDLRQLHLDSSIMDGLQDAG
jgi:hypothetical protein